YVHNLDYRGRRERVKRLGVKGFVRNRAEVGPRFDVAVDLPILAEDFYADPIPWERPCTLQVYRVGEEEPTAPEQRPPTEPGNSRPSRRVHNNHAEPCADTAGGSPQRSRTDRPERSRS